MFATPGMVFGATVWAAVDGRAAGRAVLLPAAALLLILLAPSHAEIIFRVPEVLVRHTATIREVGVGGLNGTIGAPIPPFTKPVFERRDRYKKYFVDHDISTVDARRAAAELDLDEYKDELALLLKKRPIPMLGLRIGCGVCTKQELAYCETRVLADHCCCEGKEIEPYPWLPHTCYYGHGPCRVLAGNCEYYSRLRDCCCYHPLAQRWKKILLKSGQHRVATSFGWLLPLVLVLRMYY